MAEGIDAARQGVQEMPDLRSSLEERYSNALALSQDGRDEEALVVYDELLLALVDSGNAGIARDERRELTARALVAKGVSLAHLGASEQAIGCFRTVVAEFGADACPSVREQVARAFGNLGVALARRGEVDGAIEAYDAVIHRFAGTDGTELIEQVQIAYSNKAMAYLRQGRPMDAVRAFAGVLRLADATDRIDLVADALLRSGNAYRGAAMKHDALRMYTELISRIRVSDEHLREHVATAMFNRAVVLDEIGDFCAANDAYAVFLENFAHAENEAIARMVSSAHRRWRQAWGAP
jgi:tetratricopeptide (TPR) repeat protein